MSVEQLRMISAAGYLASGVFFAATVIMFFVFRNPQLIRDITGVTARRAIEDIRRQNEEDGKSGNRVVVRKKGWNYHTGQMSPSQYASKGTSGPRAAKKAEKIGLTGTVAKRTSEETTVLVQERMEEGTTVLVQGSMGEGTTILSQRGVGENTSVLVQGSMGESITVLAQGGMNEGTTALVQEGMEKGTTALQQTLPGSSRLGRSTGGNTEDLSHTGQTQASVVVQVDIGFSESPETVD